MGRKLGQHFLARPSILERIADVACEGSPSAIVEIGPGRGALTAPLLERSSKLIAIEVDPVLVHYLRQKFQAPLESGQFELIEGDILKTDLSAWGPASIAGNLPYYITSPILTRVFETPGWLRAVFLMQVEVAERLAAAPGTRDYGYLSVLTQLSSKPELLFPVPRAAFRPPPKVDSAVVLLTPRASEPSLERERFLRFASACFRQKRKTLRNNLAPLYGRERLDAMDEGRLRAEQLGVPELIALYRKLETV